MTTMVEKVARAICSKTNIAMEGVSEVILDNPDAFIPVGRTWVESGWNSEPFPRWKLYEEQARAAVEAMMEPTEEQINHVLDLAANEKIGQSGWIEAYKEIYRAMIQAALEEKQ